MQRRVNSAIRRKLAVHQIAAAATPLAADKMSNSSISASLRYASSRQARTALSAARVDVFGLLASGRPLSSVKLAEQSFGV